MDRGLQEHDAGDRERMMLQERERLQYENSDLRELREFDRERMQNKIGEWTALAYKTCHNLE